MDYRLLGFFSGRECKFDCVNGIMHQKDVNTECVT